MAIGTRRDHAGGAKITKLSADITTGSTSCTIVDASGWPTGGVGPFFIIADAGLASEEKILVASRSGTTLTFQGGVSGRGQDGTTNTGHTSNAGDWFPVWTATEADELNAHIASTTQHGVTGALLGTTDTQNVSGKTHTTSTWSGGTFTGTIAGSPTFSGAPGLADFTNANHTHAAAASAGLLPTAAPTGSAVGDGSVTGTATTYSRTDHKHAREAFGAVTAQTSFGLSSSNGAATTDARSDHTHGTPADPIKIGVQVNSKTTDTSFGTTDTVVTSVTLTGDGSTRIMIVGSWFGITPNAGVTVGRVRIKEGGTLIKDWRWETPSASNTSCGGTISTNLIPTAAAHTYDLVVVRDTGPSGSVMPASATQPVELIAYQVR